MTVPLWETFWNNYTTKGYSLHQAAKSIDFPETTMRKWVERVGDSHEGGIPELKSRGRFGPSMLGEEHNQFILKLLESRSEWALEVIIFLLKNEFPELSVRPISVSALHKHLVQKLSFTLRRADLCTTGNDQIIKQQRYDYVDRIFSEGMIIYNVNCVFIGETVFNLHFHKTQGKSQRNEAARIIVPEASKGRNITIFGAMSHRGLELLDKNPRDRRTKVEMFLDFTDRLIQHLNEKGAQGSYIIYDNAPVDSAQVAIKLHEAGYKTLKLPPLSPFLNPIDELFSKLMERVKKHKLEDGEDLHDRITESENRITADDCQSCIGHSTQNFTRCLQMEDI